MKKFLREFSPSGKRNYSIYNRIKNTYGLKVLKNIFIFLGLLYWSFLTVFADTKQNIKIQSYLNDLGYKVGKADGIVGKNTKKNLINALEENGYVYDGLADSNELIILKQIAKAKDIDLNERFIGLSHENLAQIMDVQTANLFVANDRNIGRVDAFEIVDFKGRRAAKMSISMNDKGHPDDWGRFGTSGAAQRIQVQEKPRVHEMKDGEVYWYKFSVFIPYNVGSDHHTISPFDLKDRKNGRQRDPALAFTITNNQVTFQLKTIGEECRKIKNTQGKVSSFCERPGLIANMTSNKNFKNRWLDFVFQIDLRKGKEITRFWINEKLKGVINGDLSPHGKFLGFKFGPYRNSINMPPNDEVIYYADIMRRHSCEELETINCDKLNGAPTFSGIYGAEKLLRCFREPDQGLPCPLICEGRNCEKL